MKIFLLSVTVVISLTLASCYHSSEDVLATNEKYVTFSLNAVGTEQSSLTRVITEPNHLLIIDKFDDKITTDEKTSLADFAMPLDYGKHEIYFVAATNAWESYSTEDLTVTWPSAHFGLGRVWAYHLTLEVNQNTNVEEITLPLVVSLVRLESLDNIAENVSSVSYDNSDLCKGLDLSTMSGFVTESSVKNTFNIPAESVGVKTLILNIYTFVPTSGCVGDISIFAYDSDSKEVATKTLNAVPVQKGYVSLYKGYFFSDGVILPLSYDEDWTGTNTYKY